MYDVAEVCLALQENRLEIVAELSEAIGVCEVPRLRAIIARAEGFGLDHADDLSLLQDAVSTMQRELWPQARAGLQQAVDKREIALLREALAEAETVGLAQEELEPARRTLREEERKVVAREGLVEPLRLKDVNLMAAAVAEGEHAGLEEEELAEIRAALALEKAKADARLALQRATKSRQVQQLQAALQEAESCHLEGAEVYEAKRTLVDEQTKIAARSTVDKAVQSRDVTELKAALKQGLASGLEEGELQREEIKLEAQATLENALKSRDIEELQTAIRQAQAASLDAAQLRPARGALEEEQKKVQAKSGLEKAIKRREMKALRKALAEGEAVGLGREAEEMRIALETLAFEEAKAAAKEQLAHALNVLSYDTIDTLRAAIDSAVAAGLDSVLVDPAKAKLATLERQISAKRELEDALASGGLSDLAAAISRAEGAGLASADEHLTSARQTHAAEKRRVKARQGLFDAIQTRNIEHLHKAIEEGRASGIPEEEVQEASDILSEEVRKAHAHDALHGATWSRSILDLRAAILEAEDAGVDEEELMEVRQLLGLEERRADARAALDAATQGREVEALEEALEEAEACGLTPKETEVARQVLAEENRKLAALEGLHKATASRAAELLSAAIAEAEAAGLEAPELDDARSALVHEQQQIGGLRDALAEAINLGLPSEELAAAQMALRQEERKEAAKDALAEAMMKPEIGTLEMALQEALQAGLPEADCLPAQAALEDAKHLAEVRGALDLAMRSRDARRLSEALLAAEQCGLAPEELAAGEAVLKEARLRESRAALQKAVATQDVSTLFHAVAEGEAAGLDPEDLDSAKAALQEKVRKATEDGEELLFGSRASLLPAAGDLAFEVARQSLSAKGFGGFDWKVREHLAFGTVAVGQELAATLERAWFAKKMNILEELCQNLQSCLVTSNGKASKSQALDKTILLKLGRDIKSRINPQTDETWMNFPIALATMLLYTQQDVDTDRTFLFLDCPSSAVGPQLFAERKEAYDTYRSRRGPGRNPMLAAQVGRVATAVLHSALSAGMRQGADPVVELPLRQWVKSACLLSVCRQTFEEPRVLTRMLMNLSDRGIQELRKKQKDDVIVCPQILSTSANPTYVDKYLFHGAANLEQHVILTIRNVTECLDLAALSQYPEEQEVLLPLLSVLRVEEVSAVPGQALRVSCQFQGSMMSSRLRAACLSDLAMASYDLLQGIRPLPEKTVDLTISTQRPSDIEPHQYTAKVFQSLVTIFEAIDRRGAWMISRADYSWAQEVLARSFGVKRVLRKLTAYFAKSSIDLTLHRFFLLAMPGATDYQLERAYRWTARFLRKQHRAEAVAESPAGSPVTPQLDLEAGSPTTADRSAW